MNMDILSKYQEIDTPALIVDEQILLKNITDMQRKCDAMGVKLRPHIKTHKSPDIAKMQIKAGACGITAAKASEAEAMVAHGIKDIFISSEIVGRQKLERLTELQSKIQLSFAVDSIENARQIDEMFGAASLKANVLIEVETGEGRCGVTSREQMEKLGKVLRELENINVLGVFTHEGYTYDAKSVEQCLEQFEHSQSTLLEYARIAESLCEGALVVSVGATPTAWLSSRVLPGITELRPGTYSLMDAAQVRAINDYGRCAATVLTTVISKPTEERLVCDVGAKGITAQTRPGGICKTDGYGLVRGANGVFASKVYDEHMIINSKALCGDLKIGDKIEIIPNHICPVCNLYDEIILVEGGSVKGILPVACKGLMK